MSAFATISDGLDLLSPSDLRKIQGSDPAAVQVRYRLGVLANTTAVANGVLMGISDQLRRLSASVNTQVARREQARLDSVRESPREREAYLAPFTAAVEQEISARDHMKAAEDREAARARTPRANLDAANRTIAALPGEPEIVIPQPGPKGKDRRAAVIDLLSVRQARRSRIKEAEGKLEPASVIKGRIKAQLDDLVPDGLLKFSSKGILWPIGNGRHSSSPRDGLAVRSMLVALHYDTLLATLEAQVDEAYRGVGETMTVAERNKTIASLQAEVLAIERTIAGIIWAAKADNIEIDFPADLDGRALLGIA